jgi:O-6-methylguanine DNA methyltransferase
MEPQLQAVAAGEAGPDAALRVEQHVGDCGSCRTKLDGYQLIEAEVQGLRNPRLPEGRAALAEAHLRARLADLRRRLVAYDVLPTPLGRILLAASEQGLVLVHYLDGREDGRRVLEAHELEVAAGSGTLDTYQRDLREYLEGRRTRLEWPLDMKLVKSSFQRQVLEATAAIPYGAVMSYGGIARGLGRPEAVRAAAQALRSNPLAIVIPCHRVVGSTGTLTGYAGRQIGKKKRLLDLEGVPTTRVADDFRLYPETMYVLAPGAQEYCIPSCPSLESVKPATHAFTHGSRLFASRERAQAAGFAPCTMCRPDRHPLPA